MKTLSSPEIAAYSSRNIIARSMIYVVPKDRDSGDDVEFGFWNGNDDVLAEVVDGLTLDVVARDFAAGGAVLSIGDISLSADLTVSSVQVVLSQLNDTVQSALRTYDMRNAPIQIYRALFGISDPTTMVDAARCRFIGFVDTLSIQTPAAGGQAQAVLNCVACTRELTRTNTELRSDESQQRRSTGDRFFRYAGATGQVAIFWGLNRG